MRVTVEVDCPAKVNLFLSVGGPDPSGYHPVRTILQAVSLFDTLRVQAPADEDALSCDWSAIELPGDPGGGVPAPADNTVIRALWLARELAQMPPVSIALIKRIPDRSGLGGGSSDAAGLLRALDALFPDTFSKVDLHEIAAAVGSDVPFFLVGGAARAEGYGERLLPMPDVEPMSMVIVRPEVGVGTADAYRRLDGGSRPWREFPGSLDDVFNEFDAVAPPECAEAERELLAAGAHRACLSGSGSAVFGVFGDEPSAARAAREISSKGWRAWPVRSLTRQESLQLRRI